MTNREAIAKLKESVNYYDTECPEDKISKFAWERMQELTEVYQLAIAALEKQEVHTHADKIRALDDESLAAFLHNISTYSNHNADGETDFYMSVIYDDDEDDTVIIDSYADILKWLREDAE